MELLIAPFQGRVSAPFESGRAEESPEDRDVQLQDLAVIHRRGHAS
ncbi:MAG: hypothetical protein QXQ70_08705 [Candidatus Caldarchaeum sp.]